MKNVISELFILFVATFNLLSQNNWNINASNIDTNYIKKILTQAQQFGWNNPDSQIFYANLALELSQKLNYTEGQYYAYSLISSGCYVNGNYALGLKSAQNALALARSAKNTNWISITCNSIGLLYQQIQRYKESIDYFNEALQYIDTAKQPKRYAATVNNLANSYLYLNDIENSLKNRQIALRIRKQMNDINALADTYNDIGETFSQANMLDSAIYYLELCYKIKDSLGDWEMKSLSANNLAKTYFYKNKYSKAKYYSLIAAQYADSINAPYYKLEAFKLLLKIAEIEKDLLSEVTYLKELLKLKDTLYNIENQKQINQLYFEFETEKKELQIKNLQTKQLAAKRQFNTVVFFSLFIFVILVLFVTIIQNRYRITKQQKIKIEEQNLILENKNKEILDSINYASLIQRAMFTSNNKISYLLLEFMKFKQFMIFFRPRDIVSGDFYWFEQTNDDVFIAICDSTGHGVPGAFMSILNINLLYEAIKIKDIKQTNEIFTYIRIMLKKTISDNSEQQDGMDGVLLKFNKQQPYFMQYSAAYNAPVVYRDNQLIELKVDRKPVGNSLHTDDFNLYTFELHQGDTLFCFSDGYYDQLGGTEGKKLYKKNFLQILQSLYNLKIEDQIDYLDEFMLQFRGNRQQIDDILIFEISI